MRGPITHAMCALLPTTEGFPGVETTEPERFLKKLLTEGGFIFRLGLIAGTFVFIWSPVLSIGWPLPSVLLPRRALERHAEKICAHPWYLVRQAVFLVKMVAGLCWGQHASIRARLALAPYGEDPGTWRQQ